MTRLSRLLARLDLLLSDDRISVEHYCALVFIRSKVFERRGQRSRG